MAQELPLQGMGVYGYCGKYNTTNDGQMSVKPLTFIDYTVNVPSQKVIVSNQEGIFPLGISISVKAQTQDGEKDFGTHFVSAVAEMTSEGLRDKYFTLKIPLLKLIKRESSNSYEVTLTSVDDVSRSIFYN